MQLNWLQEKSFLYFFMHEIEGTNQKNLLQKFYLISLQVICGKVEVLVLAISLYGIGMYK